MATNETIEPLKAQISECLKYEIGNLVARTDWGSINFEAARQDLDRILSIVGHLNILPLDSLTDQAVEQIAQALGKVLDALNRLDAFSLSEGTPTQIRDQLVTEIHGQADNFYTIATPWIPFLAYQKGDVAKNISELTQSVQQASSLVDDAKSDISKKHDEIDEIVVKAREASASAGAAVFTKDFLNESKSLSDSANTWLFATAALALATLLFAALLWFVSEPTDNPWQAIQRFGARLIILGVLFTATLWCGRVYKALKHQSATNRHRGLSLKTFQAFSAAASDDATRNAVLTETTRSIFSGSQTGYIDESVHSDNQIRFLEIQKVLNSKGE